MTYLNVQDAYRLWAPTYASETVVSVLDEQLTGALSPPLEGRVVLDAGCGIGRRMSCARSRLVVGVDLSLAMLAGGRRTDVVAADIRALPFSDGQFDLIWCRLVLGHLGNLLPAFRELARVSRSGAHLLVTDFHPDAVVAGHVRNFRDLSGAVHEVEHHVHSKNDYINTAESAGYKPAGALAGLVGPSVEYMYHRADRMGAYERDKGLALVAGLLFRYENRCRS